jgi:hypothetical protein
MQQMFQMHCFSFGKLQIDSNMHPLGFVTFPVWFG